MPIDFLHHDNPPNCAGVEPATLSAEGQRQTNCAAQPFLNLLFKNYHTNVVVVFQTVPPEFWTGSLIGLRFQAKNTVSHQKVWFHQPQEEDSSDMSLLDTDVSCSLPRLLD
ncbi:hypothetical protein TNCV_1823501 [Trichonephila clavipes]|nr:hypothetical protein TNCV_1823501 [Trichonephila clavipes]